MRAINNALPGVVNWRTINHGGKGWQTGLYPSRDGTSILAHGDVVPLTEKLIEDINWNHLVRRDNCPAALFDKDDYGQAIPNFCNGSYHAGYGGPDTDTVWLTMADRVCVAGPDRQFTTKLSGLPVGSNFGYARAYSQKGATDPISRDVYHIGMGPVGVRYTLNRGVDGFLTPTGLPAPNSPVGTYLDLEMFTIIKVDEAGPNVSGGSRKARILAVPCGRGVYLSIDGGPNYTEISTGSGVGNIRAISSAMWIGNKVYVTKVDPATGYPPGGAGNGNIYCYDVDAGTWSYFDIGLPVGNDFQYLIKDPRVAHPNGFWAWLASGECVYTPDGTNFVEFIGFGAGTFPNKKFLTTQTKPRSRPSTAAECRYDSISGAVTQPAIAGAYLYLPTGLGHLRTPWATFPLAGADYNTTPFDAAWPVWEEDIGNVEENVSSYVAWAGPTNDDLICGAGDVALQHAELGERGHRATVYRYPILGLSNGTGGTTGPGGWHACRRTRNGPNPAAGSCYSLDGKTFQDFPNQFTVGNTETFASGMCVAGPIGEVLSFPGFKPSLPQGSRDMCATAPVRLRFWKGATELDLDTWKNNANHYNGFTGISIYAQAHFVCWHDNANPGNYYVVNLGAAKGDGTEPFGADAWTADPLGWGGVYHMDSNTDWPNFRQIHNGAIGHTGNFGIYDCRLVGDNQGHLAFIPNSMAGLTGDIPNYAVIYDIAANTVRNITAAVNPYAISFGAPFPGDTQKALWIIATKPDGTYGLHLSRDLGLTIAKTFSTITPLVGLMRYIEAHPTKFGVVAASVHSRGHVIGEYSLGT